MIARLTCGCKVYQYEDYDLMGLVECYWLTWEVGEDGPYQGVNFGVLCEGCYDEYGAKYSPEELQERV